MPLCPDIFDFKKKTTLLICDGDAYMTTLTRCYARPHPTHILAQGGIIGVPDSVAGVCIALPASPGAPTQRAAHRYYHRVHVCSHCHGNWHRLSSADWRRASNAVVQGHRDSFYGAQRACPPSHWVLGLRSKVQTEDSRRVRKNLEDCRGPIQPATASPSLPLSLSRAPSLSLPCSRVLISTR